MTDGIEMNKTPDPRNIKINPKLVPPSIYIAWSPTAISAEQYRDLVVATGDFVRECGGAGIQRVKSSNYSLKK